MLSAGHRDPTDVLESFMVSGVACQVETTALYIEAMECSVVAMAIFG